MDVYIFNAIHDLVGISPVLDDIGIFLARYLAFVLVGILAVSVMRPGERGLKNRFALLEAIAAALIARFGITVLIRMIVHRTRPFIDGSFKELISIDASEYYGSFPSGHAAFFFAIATVVWFHNRRLGNYFYIGAILMGLGRIFVGVHWPSDILAGATIGILTGLVTHRFWRRMTTRFFHPRIS